MRGLDSSKNQETNSKLKTNGLYIGFYMHTYPSYGPRSLL